jgi:hypothetical protein
MHIFYLKFEKNYVDHNVYFLKVQENFNVIITLMLMI